MKLFDYFESQIRTKLGEILSDYWEQGKGVSPVKASQAANEFYEEVILDGVYEFIEYVSDIEGQDKEDKDVKLSPEAKKFSLAFIESLKKKLDELKREIL
jgi:uncharacterized protein YaaR (DUF327 family)